MLRLMVKCSCLQVPGCWIFVQPGLMVYEFLEYARHIPSQRLLSAGADKSLAHVWKWMMGSLLCHALYPI